MFAHSLTRPRDPLSPELMADADNTKDGNVELARYSYVGGNFGIPHRDHSSADCFGSLLLSMQPATDPVVTYVAAAVVDGGIFLGDDSLGYVFCEGVGRTMCLCGCIGVHQ